MRRLILALASGLGVGYSPRAPGTLGSLVGIGLYLLLRGLTSSAYLITLPAFILFSVWIAAAAAVYWGEKDPKKVVIDEIAGMLVTMALVPFSWGMVGIGFVLFRLFDVIKPWPCNRLEHLSGGWGIVLDDVMAGVYANLILQALTRFVL